MLGMKKFSPASYPDVIDTQVMPNDMKILSLVPSVADLRIKIFGSESCSFLSFFLANSDPHPFLTIILKKFTIRVFIS